MNQRSFFLSLRYTNPITESPIFFCARSLGGKRGREHQSCLIALCMVEHSGQNYSSGSADFLATATERHGLK